MPFQAGGAGVTTLSDLEIDVDKDWKAHGIYSLGDLTPKVDGAYNIGGPNAQFDTVYAGLTDNAVTSPKLASDAIYKRHLRTGVVDTSYLTDSAITTPKIADGDVTSPKLESDVVYKRHLRTGVVDTSYLTDDAATPAKVAPSVDLEFVRSNDNVVAGDIDAAADGAYNLGSSSVKFDTAYASNFPGAGISEVGSGSDLTVKGITYQLTESGFLGTSAVTDRKVWFKLYTTPAAFELASDAIYGDKETASGPTVPKSAPGTADPNPQPGALWSVSMIPDGTPVGGFASPAPSPDDMMWDGTYLWNADSGASYIYQLNKDGTQAGGFATGWDP